MIARPSFFAPVQVGSSSRTSSCHVLLPWADPYIARLHAEHLLAAAEEECTGDDEPSEILMADEECPADWLESISTTN